MRKFLVVLMMVFAISAVQAAGTIDVSSVSEESMDRLDRISNNMRPEAAISRALSMSTHNMPMGSLGQTFSAQISSILVEYGIMESIPRFGTVEVIGPERSRIIVMRMVHRYQYLRSISIETRQTLQGMLEMWKEE